MPTIEEFRAALRSSYPDGLRNEFVRDQYTRLASGERGSALADASLVAWERITR